MPDTTLPFLTAHATHPDWRAATELVLTQLEGAVKTQGRKHVGNTGFLYISDLFSEHASDILTLLKIRTGVSVWTGCTGIMVFANAAEYADEPAVCVMVGTFAHGGVRIFSGKETLPKRQARLLRHDELSYPDEADGALESERCLVHADPRTPMLDDVIAELKDHMHNGDVFGGLVSSRHVAAQFADFTFAAGVSGAVFASHVDIRTRMTQGCYPVHPSQRGWRVLEHEGQWISAVSNQTKGLSALRALLQDLSLLDEAGEISEVNADDLRAKLEGGVFVKVTPPSQTNTGSLAKPGELNHTIHNLTGIDPLRGSISVAGELLPGSTVQFCKRSVHTAKSDLIRICTELREEFEEANLKPRGALLISCITRGQQLFGVNGAELGIVQRALGYSTESPLPIVGFAANGEIAHAQLHAHSAVLIVFA